MKSTPPKIEARAVLYYELAPDEYQSGIIACSRWFLDYATNQWTDRGCTGKWTSCVVGTIWNDFASLHTNGVDVMYINSIPVGPGSVHYLEAQWDLPGFFTTINPHEAKATKRDEEECPSCRRMKDIGQTCWCCGYGKPGVRPSGLDTNRTIYGWKVPL